MLASERHAAALAALLMPALLGACASRPGRTAPAASGAHYVLGGGYAFFFNFL